MKKRFKVLLLYPNLMMKNLVPPAIGVLTACLRSAGYEVALFDTTYYLTETHNPDEKRQELLQVRSYDPGEYGIHLKADSIVEDFRAEVERFRPDLIGVSVVEDTLSMALRLIEALGAERPPTVWGGIHVSHLREKAFQFPAVDFICMGEGEETLIELCDALSEGRDVSFVQNLGFRKDNRVILNPCRKLVDINSVPVPDYSLFDERRFYSPMQGRMYRMLPIEFDRGCPFNCTFCAAPGYSQWYREQTGESYFRKKNLDKIVEELEIAMERYQPEYLYFNSDTFLSYPDDKLNEILTNIKRIANLPFWCQTRVETVREDRIRLLKDSGCDRMSIGLEHGNEDFRRKFLKKTFSNQQFIEATRIINNVGIPISVNSMIGFPGETIDLIFDTIELNRKVEADSLSVFIFYPYVGTWLHRYCIENDLIEEGIDQTSLLQNSVLKNPNISRDHLNNLLKTFCLYVKFPKARWREIREVERNRPGSDKIFKKLSEEYQKEYF